jgi:hypothetical protein
MKLESAFLLIKCYGGSTITTPYYDGYLDSRTTYTVILVV